MKITYRRKLKLLSKETQRAFDKSLLSKNDRDDFIEKILRREYGLTGTFSHLNKLLDCNITNKTIRYFSRHARKIGKVVRIIELVDCIKARSDLKEIKFRNT